MTRSRCRARRHRSGQTLLEMAIVINILLMILMGVFEYGRIAMIKQLMDNAARQGARQAAVSTNTNPPTTTAQIQTTVQNLLVGQPLNNLTISVYQASPTTGNNIGSWNATPFGGLIAVEIDANYPPITPVTFGVLPNPLPLTAKAVVTSEAD